MIAGSCSLMLPSSSTIDNELNKKVFFIVTVKVIFSHPLTKTLHRAYLSSCLRRPFKTQVLIKLKISPF